MHPRLPACREFAARLELVTEGRLRVEIFSGGQLYGARQSVLAAAVGDVEMAMEPETHFITFNDAFKAIDIPFLFDTQESFRRFLEGEFRDQIAASFEDRGLVLVALWDEGPMILGSRTKMLRTPDDFRGVKIRSSGHEILARAWNELGAATIRVPIHEVYTALQQGVADAIYTTLNAFTSTKSYEVAPKTIVWPSRATYVWVANRDFWNRLSPEDQETIRRLAEEATDLYYQTLVQREEGMVGQILGVPGGQYEELTAEEVAVFRSRLKSQLLGWQEEYASVLGAPAPSDR
jgi:C4-dicarboxylate-binding protein DctP